MKTAKLRWVAVCRRSDYLCESLSLSGSNLYHQLNVFGADEDDERAASGEGPLPRAGCPQRKAGSVQGKCKQGHAPAIPSLRFHGFLLILQPVEPAPNPAASRVGGVSQRSRVEVGESDVDLATRPLVLRVGSFRGQQSRWSGLRFCLFVIEDRGDQLEKSSFRGKKENYDR